MGDGAERSRLHASGQRLGCSLVDDHDTRILLPRVAQLRRLRIRAQLVGASLRTLGRLAGCARRGQARGRE